MRYKNKDFEKSKSFLIISHSNYCIIVDKFVETLYTIYNSSIVYMQYRFAVRLLWKSLKKLYSQNQNFQNQN